MVKDKTFYKTNLGKDKHKAWLVFGISIAVLLVLVLVLYSPVREGLFGKAPETLQTQKTVSLIEKVKCDATLKNTKTITLTKNLNCERHGLTLAGSDMVLDCGRYKIRGSGISDFNGITVGGPDVKNVVIKNCKVENFGTGIFVNQAENVELEKNNVVNNRKGGIRIVSSSAILKNNKANSGTDPTIGPGSSRDFYCSWSTITPGPGNEFKNFNKNDDWQSCSVNGEEDSNYPYNVQGKYQLDKCATIVGKSGPDINAITLGDSGDNFVWETGKTYYLVNDVSVISTERDQGDCIRFNRRSWTAEANRPWAKDIILDCQGHKITGAGSSNPNTEGIILEGENTGMTIKNCEISGFETGIKIQDDWGWGGTVFNHYGGSDNNKILSNTLTGNGKGIVIKSSSYNIVGSDNKVEGNTIKDNSDWGIWIEALGRLNGVVKTAGANVLKNNILTENAGGIALGDDVKETVLEGNYIRSVSGGTDLVCWGIADTTKGSSDYVEEREDGCDLVENTRLEVPACQGYSCNPSNAHQYCSAGAWTDCPTSQDCRGGQCFAIAEQPTNCYCDQDSDNYISKISAGTIDYGTCAGNFGPGCSETQGTDCDDSKQNIYPSATEVSCDNIDNDCNAATLDSATEVCNGVDDNCDGEVDEDEAADSCAWGQTCTNGQCTTTPIPSVCTGTAPTHATLCTGDDTGLTANIQGTLVGACTEAVKCEYTCDTSYTLTNGACAAVGLVAKYTFDETISGGDDFTDSSGKGNGGTLYLTQGSRLNSGCISGNCLSFKGESDYALVTNSPSLSNYANGVTVCMWFKADEVNRQQGLFGQNVHPTNYLNFWMDSGTASTKLRWETDNQQNFNSNKDILPNTWYFACGVYDTSQSKAKLYLDGVLDKEEVKTFTISNTADLFIGAYGNSYRFKGIIDEVKIYNKALSETEIKGIYNVEKPSAPTNLDTDGDGVLDSVEATACKVIGEVGLVSASSSAGMGMSGCYYGDTNGNGCLDITEYTVFKAKYKTNQNGIKSSLTLLNYTIYKAKYKSGATKCAT